MNVNGTGKRYNNSKITFHSIPPQVLVELAKVATLGEMKYPDDADGFPNWTHGFSYSSVLDCLKRHLLLFESGESYDSELQVHHLGQVMWNAMVLLFFDLNKKLYEQFDDRPYKGYTIDTVIDPQLAKKLAEIYQKVESKADNWPIIPNTSP